MKDEDNEDLNKMMEMYSFLIKVGWDTVSLDDVAFEIYSKNGIVDVRFELKTYAGKKWCASICRLLDREVDKINGRK